VISAIWLARLQLPIRVAASGPVRPRTPLPRTTAGGWRLREILPRWPVNSFGLIFDFDDVMQDLFWVVCSFNAQYSNRNVNASIRFGSVALGVPATAGFDTTPVAGLNWIAEFSPLYSV
jgi:hypothetical protein